MIVALIRDNNGRKTIHGDGAKCAGPLNSRLQNVPKN